MQKAVVILDMLDNSELVKDVCYRAECMYNFFGTRSIFIFLKPEWYESESIQDWYDIDSKEYIEKFIISSETNDLSEIISFINGIVSSEDSAFFDKRVITLANKNVYLDDISKSLYTLEKVAVLHECHLNPDTNYTTTTQDYDVFFKNIQNFTKFAVSTVEQKNDLMKLTAIDSTKIIVTQCSATLTPINYNTSNICVVCSNERSVNSALYTMQQILKSIPTLKLDVYLYSEVNQQLIDLVETLGIRNSINFLLKPQDMTNVYKKYSVCLYTDCDNGICKSVIECEFAGTPVISFNSKYGISISVINNTNGNIVSNIIEMANSVVNLINSSKTILAYKKNTAQIVKTINSDLYKKAFSLLAEKSTLAVLFLFLVIVIIIISVRTN